MSHLIDYLASQQQHQNQRNISQQGFTQYNFRQLLKRYTSLSDSIKYFNNNHHKCCIVLQIALCTHLPTVIQKIEIDKKKNQYYSKFVFRNSGALLNCQTKNLRLMAIMELERLRKRMKLFSIVLNIGLDSGQMVAKNIFSIAPNANVFELMLFQLIPIKMHFTKFLSIIMFRTNQLPPFFSQLINQRTGRVQQVSIQQRIQKRIYKYYNYSIVQLCQSLSQSPSNSIQDPKDKQLKQKLLNQTFQGFQQQNSQLYYYRPKSRFFDKNKFSICQQQSDNIKTHLFYPKSMMKKSQSNMFNQIKVIQQGAETLSTRSRGGSNKIIITRIKFMYMNSLTNPGLTYNNKTLATRQHIRIVGIKIPIDPIRQNYKKSTQHQIKILKLFTDIESPFLLRYFVDSTPSFKYNNLLMMQFMNNSDRLEIFLAKFHQVLSFNSKLHILINLLQALRFIKDYKVVHMDLSPANLLVHPNLITSLIDFGESYHEKVCDRNYYPGYTLPYTFPQKFTQKSFTPKSDIFSFAIILYLTIFNAYPYQPTSKLLKSLKNFTYRNKFFLAPECADYFGYRKIISFLISYIQKCMDPNQLFRPHPSQSIIIFKQLYYWFEEISMTL